MVFQLGTIEHRLAQVSFSSMMCLSIRTKTFVKIVLEQISALFFNAKYKEK